MNFASLLCAGLVLAIGANASCADSTGPSCASESCGTGTCSMMNQPNQSFVNPHVYNKQLQVESQRSRNRQIGTPSEDRSPGACNLPQQYINPFVFNKVLQRIAQDQRNAAIGTPMESFTPTMCTESHSPNNPWVQNKQLQRGAASTP